MEYAPVTDVWSFTSLQAHQGGKHTAGHSRDQWLPQVIGHWHPPVPAQHAYNFSYVWKPRFHMV